MGDLPTGASSVVGMGGVDVLEGKLEWELPEDGVLTGGISGTAEGVDEGGEPVGLGIASRGFFSPGSWTTSTRAALSRARTAEN